MNNISLSSQQCLYLIKGGKPYNVVPGKIICNASKVIMYAPIPHFAYRLNDLMLLIM